MRPTVKITGIKEFQRSLRKMDAGLAKTIRVTLNGAAEIVVHEAARTVPTRTGAARASLKVRSSQREARVAAGGRRAPYYPWLDFGGRVGPADSVVRPFLTEGRYVYPAVRRRHEDITEAMSTGLTDLARAAGLEST